MFGLLCCITSRSYFSETWPIKKQLDFAAKLHAILFHENQVPLASFGNRKRRQSFRDLENRRRAAYFMRHDQKGFAIGAVLFFDE
jgi:hypothetical protein